MKNPDNQEFNPKTEPSDQNTEAKTSLNRRSSATLMHQSELQEVA